MSDFYVLKDGVAVPATNVLTWAKWFDESLDQRRLRMTTVGDSEVSTVFIGINNSFCLGPPLLWETMVFGGPLDGEQVRHATREQALVGHDEMAARVAQSVLS